MDAAKKYFLNPGYIFITKEDYEIETILGSCVSLCLFDNIHKVYGMNHYVIFANPGNMDKSHSGRYGKDSIKHLISEMLLMGAELKNIKAYIVGGAGHPVLGEAVGNDNIKIAKDMLAKAKIEIIKEDTGGNLGRKLLFLTKNAEIKVYYINSEKTSFDNIKDGDKNGKNKGINYR